MRPFGLALLLVLATAACAATTPAPQAPAPAPAPAGAEPAAPATPTPPAAEAAPPAAAPSPTPADPIPADAERLPSGLATKVLRPGHGATHPVATSRVTVHYQGWLTDGTVFDSSYRRGRPATFPLNAVIAGWTEGVQLMVVGEKRRLWIPEHLAYQGRPGRPPGMLIFDVELLAIEP